MTFSFIGSMLSWCFRSRPPRARANSFAKTKRNELGGSSICSWVSNGVVIFLSSSATIDGQSFYNLSEALSVSLEPASDPKPPLISLGISASSLFDAFTEFISIESCRVYQFVSQHVHFFVIADAIPVLFMERGGCVAPFCRRSRLRTSRLCTAS